MLLRQTSLQVDATDFQGYLSVRAALMQDYLRFIRNSFMKVRWFVNYDIDDNYKIDGNETKIKATQRLIKFWLLKLFIEC